MYKGDRNGLCKYNSIFNNSSKKGQVTVFIIIGIFVLAVAGFIFYVVSNTTTEEVQSQRDFPVQLTSLQSFVNSCLSDSTVEGLYQTLANGGAYAQELTDPNYLDFTQDQDLFEVPFYCERSELGV
jgi:hypothetical protein